MSPDDAGRPEHEPDSGPTSSRVAPGPPSAKHHKSRWPGWIWAIPIAAVLIVGWLGFKQFASSGPEITVTFKTASGIQAGNTHVEYHGLQVGQVEAVHLQKDMQHVDLKIRMDADMEGHLGKGTEFWIAGANPSLSNLSSLKSIVSGPTIGIMPKPGHKQDHYEGLPEPPVVQETVSGRHFILHAANIGNVSRGSSVYVADQEAGSVESTNLEPDHSFKLMIFIKAPYDGLVHTGTRFWNAGAAQLSMQPNGPKLQLQSVSALMKGAVGFTMPSADNGPPAPDGQQFPLYPSKDAAEYAPGPNAIIYRVVFPAEGGGLQANAPVELAGKRVGTVQDSTLVYDPHGGKLTDEVTIALEPRDITLAGGAKWPAKPRAQMDALVQSLIGDGMRAQLGSSVPMVGPKTVELAFVQDAGPAALIPGNPPEIPASGAGSGIGGIMTAVNKIAGKIDALPLDQIGQNIKEISGRIATLSKSPQLTATIENLDRSVAHVEHMTAAAQVQLPSLVSELRRVASQADQTVAAARGLINNQYGATATGVNSAGLSQTLYELSQAARSVRQLADMLDRNPSALIRGRG